MMPQHDHHNDHDSNDDHDSMIFKGLVAVLGIIFFFITERGLTVIAEWRKKQQKKDKVCCVLYLLINENLFLLKIF